MKVFYLTRQFYNNVVALNLAEILHKDVRPYAMVIIKIKDQQFAIPFRHNIARHRHSHFYPTIEVLNVVTGQMEQAGLDYTKAVIIQSTDIDYKRIPRIDTAEFNSLKGKDTVIANQVKNFVEEYCHAVARQLSNQSLPRDYFLLQTSSLQYFHDKLGLL